MLLCESSAHSHIRICLEQISSTAFSTRHPYISASLYSLWIRDTKGKEASLSSAFSSFRNRSNGVSSLGGCMYWVRSMPATMTAVTRAALAARVVVVVTLEVAPGEEFVEPDGEFAHVDAAAAARGAVMVLRDNRL
jgi:hypothetical protein